eukprot:12912091-Prorocentrum_lima.AAC.1
MRGLVDGHAGRAMRAATWCAGRRDGKSRLITEILGIHYYVNNAFEGYQAMKGRACLGAVDTITGSTSAAPPSEPSYHRV